MELSVILKKHYRIMISQTFLPKSKPVLGLLKQGFILSKKYTDFFYSHKLQQLTVEPIRNNEHTKSLIGHILTKSSVKGIQRL